MMKFTQILLLLTMTVVSIFVIFHLLSIKNEKKKSGIPQVLMASISNSPQPTPLVYIKKDVDDLQGIVDEALEGTKGTYGIVIQDLKSGETYRWNEHTVYDSASLYKLWVMATVYRQIQGGQLSEDQELSQEVQVLNQKFRIDEESAELTEGTITLSVNEALEKMITISDNYAALLLTENIRLSAVARFLKDNSFSESTVGSSGGAPTSTASDIALFLEKLYNGELASPEYTDEMITLLKKQQLNNGIPKYISKEASSIAHKTGEIGVFKHDAAIVYSDSGDYIIVVLSESADPQSAQERIARLSDAVYRYFTREK